MCTFAIHYFLWICALMRTGKPVHRSTLQDYRQCPPTPAAAPPNGYENKRCGRRGRRGQTSAAATAPLSNGLSLRTSELRSSSIIEEGRSFDASILEYPRFSRRCGTASAGAQRNAQERCLGGGGGCGDAQGDSQGLRLLLVCVLAPHPRARRA